MNMPLKLYSSSLEDSEGRAIATLHLDQNRHQLVIDTYLIDFDKAIDTIGRLKRVSESDKPDHRRYFIEVAGHFSLEMAAKNMMREMAKIDKEMADVGEVWDVWKETED